MIANINYKSLLIIGLLGWLSNGSWAQGDGIFKYAPSPVLKQKQQHYLQAQQQVAVAGTEYFVRLTPADFLNKNNLTLNLPTGDLQLDRVNVKKNRSGRYELTGKITGQSGHFLLVYNPFKETFTGQIIFEQDYWKIMPLGDKVHVLFEPRHFPNDCRQPPASTNSQNDVEHFNPDDSWKDPEAHVEKSMAGECSIRLLVAHSDEVEAVAVDILATIDLLIMEFNNINSGTNVDFTVELAVAEGVSINEDNEFDSNGYWVDLVQFQDTDDGSMDYIHDIRTLYDADMSILLVSESIPTGPNQSVIGQAFAIGATRPTAFAIAIWNSSSFTLTHEFGHLLGMRHDDDDTDTPYSYGHGFVNDNLGGNSFRTVMGKSGSCSVTCGRIPQWSSSTVNWNGNSTGNSTTRNNARVARAAETIAADWESTTFNKVQFLQEVIANNEEGHWYGSNSFTNSTYILEYQNGSVGSITAGSSIRLRPGFRAKRGSRFSTVLDNCSANALTDSGDTELRTGEVTQTNQSKPIPTPLSLTVQPNPVQDILTVRFVISETVAPILELFDVAGKPIFRQFIPTILESGVHHKELNMADLASGIYYLKLTSADANITQKIIKISKGR